MKTVFSHMVVNYAEYQYYNALNDSDRVDFLFGIYDAEFIKLNGLDLANFFEGIQQTLLDKQLDAEPEYQIDYFDIPEDANRVDVMIDDENIMIESNSLKALRYVTYKYVELGYILQRDRSVEKMFRKDKVTRYLRVFRIINQLPDLCFN